VKSVTKRLAPLISLALFAAALWVLHRELAAHPPREIAATIRAIPQHILWAALGLTAIGYSFLPAYDAIGLAYVRRKLSLKRTVFIGYVANSFSQTLGFGLLTGGGIRFRLYSAWGLSGSEITQIIAVSALTSWSGGLFLAGLGLVTGPVPLSASSVPGPLLGAAFLTVIAAYFIASILKLGPLRIGGWEVTVPKPKLAFTQVIIAAMDWTVAASVLYVLIPPDAHVQFSTFVAVFLLAHLAGVVSHVPGGLGVFETTILLLLKDNVPTAAILGSLVVFRIFFFILPFVVALILFGAYEVLAQEGTVAKVAREIGRWLPAAAPWVLSGVTFVAGTVLVFSGAIPTEGSRLVWLGRILPLAVIEASHFVGSLVGVGLLILAWGLRRRLDAAYHMTVLFLAAGAVTSLLTSFNWHEALLLTFVLALLLPTRSHFHRKASLTQEPFSTSWVLAVGVVLLSSTWLGFFLYRHVAYSTELWWHFALRGDAPRFLRATVGIFVAASAFGLARLLRPARRTPVFPTAEDIELAAKIVATSPRANANVALLGDKFFLFNESETGFVMYAVSGHSWIAMGDPVSPADDMEDLVWSFRETVAEHGGLTVFYQIAPERLPLYLDLGLRPLKLGEEARVPLTTFSLAGGARSWMRQVRRQLEKQACTFEVIPRHETPRILHELRDVSDSWLAEKGTREKQFSLGRFDPAYVVRFPIGVVKREGEIVAFTNLWCAAPGTEVSPDMMRYRPDAPKQVMDFLFIEAIVWAQAQGYGAFNLGMAPLSGFEDRSLAPLWSRVNAVVYRHGEHFYNFQGLRKYKEKFDPEWLPKYLAAPGGLALPRVLTDTTTLISGGMRGVIAR